jgi:hypothetical protein
MEKEIIEKYISRIESIEKRPATDALNELYTIQFYSCKELSKRWNIGNNRFMPILLDYFNIPIRKGTEAVKAQWINADERKDKQRGKMRSYVTKVPHANLGKTKETSESIKRQSEWMKINSCFRNPEIWNKCIIGMKRAYALHPDLHINARTKPTKCEQIMIDHIHSLGYEIKHNFNISPYWINVFIPKLNIAIECFKSTRLPFDYQRHYYITSKNITIIYIDNRIVQSDRISMIDYYIEIFDSLRSLPSFNSKNTMIIGTKNITPFINNFEELTIELININKVNCLFISASTQHEITNP